MQPVRLDTPEAHEIIKAELQPLGLKLDVNGMNVALFVVRKLVEQGRIRDLTSEEGKQYIVGHS